MTETRTSCRIAEITLGCLMAAASFGWALSVSPAHTEVRLVAGGTTTAVITVMNPHDEPYDVEVSEKPWFIYEDNRKIRVEDWLKLPLVKHFRLKPGKSREVKITVRCPKDALGELMGMVSFTYQGMKSSMVTPMISTAVYLDVIGTEKNTGEIVSLRVGAQNGRCQVGAQVRATGNVRLRPSGKAHLLNDQGQTVAEYIIAESNPIFPGTVKEYTGRGPDNVPPAGHYKVAVDLFSGTLELKKESGLIVKSNGDIEMETEAAKP